jgi:hypothetical protein
VPRRAIEPDALGEAQTVAERGATPSAVQMPVSTQRPARPLAEIEEFHRRPERGGPVIGL